MAEAEAAGECAAHRRSERKGARAGGGGEPGDACLQTIWDKRLADAGGADAVERSREVLERPAKREEDDRCIPGRNGQEKGCWAEEKECGHDCPTDSETLGDLSAERGAGEPSDLPQRKDSPDESRRQPELANGVDDDDRPDEPEGKVRKRVREQKWTQVLMPKHVASAFPEVSPRRPCPVPRHLRPLVASRHGTDEERRRDE